MDDKVAQDEFKLDLENRRWINRRKMAWVALYVGCGFACGTLAIIAFGSLDRVKLIGDLGPVVLGFMGFFGGIVMAYIGSAAYSDVKLWK
jgi:hypothetical protein